MYNQPVFKKDWDYELIDIGVMGPGLDNWIASATKLIRSPDRQLDEHWQTPASRLDRLDWYFL